MINLQRKKHAIQLDGQRVFKQVEEAIGDGLAQILDHYKDRSVTATASTLTIKIAVQPTDPTKEKFETLVTDSVTYAKRAALRTKIFPTTNDDGKIELLHSDPDDLELPFDHAEQEAVGRR